MAKANTVLTFADPCPDLRYLVGDVVQSKLNELEQNQNYSDGTISGSPTTPGTTWDKAFDGKMIIGDVGGVYNLAAVNAKIMQCYSSARTNQRNHSVRVYERKYSGG